MTLKNARVRSRGRPRKFDRAAAIDAAKNTFLLRGFSGATLDELGEAMKIHRPSLYAAFTDKETLYRVAIESYAAEIGEKFRSALENEASISRALRKLFTEAIDVYLGQDEAVGCLVVCTGITEATVNPAIKDQTKGIIESIDRLIARRIERAVREGELPVGTNARSVGRVIAGVLHTLSIRARAGTGKRVLEEIADEAVALVTGKEVG